jgi:integrase
MANALITKRAVDAAKPGSVDYFIWDAGERDAVKGFGLKITPAGGKVYVFQYRITRPGDTKRAPAKRYTIGKHGKLTPDQARKRAKGLAEMVERGIDPRKVEQAGYAAEDETERLAAEKARLDGQLAFENVAVRWLDHYENEKARRPSSVNLAKLVVNRYLQPRLAGKPMPHIGRADLQPILDAIPVKRRGIRRAVFAYASILFGWAHKRGDIDVNPLMAMAKPDAPDARDRVLADDELAAVWTGANSLPAPFGPFFRLLILTGQRRSEVSGMGWAELDRATATWTIPAARAKNKAAHIVSLSPATLEELDRLALAAQVKAKAPDQDGKRWPKASYVLTTTGRTPISGITKAKNALDAAATDARDGQPLEAWRIHDLRRTMATGFQRLGVRFEVTEATLNHVSGAKGGVAGIYQRHDWRDEKQSALEAWARHVAAIIAPADADNVVPINAAQKIAG